MKILFTGGGTAGHIIPIIAIIREIKKTYQKGSFQLFYIGPRDKFAQMLFNQEKDIKVKYILAGKIRREFSLKNIFLNLIDIFLKTPFGIIQAFFYIFFIGPNLIFSKGGFGSMPSVLAGKALFIPIFLHESDIIPGKVNQFLSKFAVEVFISFSKAEYFSVKKIIFVGNPIRKEILNASRDKAKEFFKINSIKPVILILGGSQGSQRINDKILTILPVLLKNFEIIHQCGENNFKEIDGEVKIMLGKNEELKNSYHLFSFLNEKELGLAYAISDLIVSRAGSGSIFEIAAVNKPSILIPLPESAQNHQIRNAYHYGVNGACIVLEETNFTSNFFLERLRQIFAHPEVLKKMSQGAKEFSKPESAKIIAEYILEYLTKK
jgi:UDP-N-acetylglucosamine--N-acetylmuramyl-(pentapeptide) pyrophosphoryl-undecaprenol N-acetylglucosamine transferase